MPDDEKIIAAFLVIVPAAAYVLIGAALRIALARGANL